MYCFIRILTRSMSPDFEWEVVDKYIDEPHTTFIPVINGKSSVLVPTRTKRKYILVVSGYAGNKQVEERFEVTANEYKHYEIGNTFIQDAILENKEEDLA